MQTIKIAKTVQTCYESLGRPVDWLGYCYLMHTTFAAGQSRFSARGPCGMTSCEMATFVHLERYIFLPTFNRAPSFVVLHMRFPLGDLLRFVFISS
jgi:hypothetical protein